MAARSFLSAVPPSGSPRPASNAELAGFAESETRLKQARREREDVEADIQASLLAAFDELDELDSQAQIALPSNRPALPPAMPRVLRPVTGGSKLPAHMPPLPTSQPHIFVAKRKVTPPPLPVSALAIAPAAVPAAAPVPASAAAPAVNPVRLSPARRSPWITRVMLVLCAALALAAVAVALWPGLHGVPLESLKPAWFGLLRSL